MDQKIGHALRILSDEMQSTWVSDQVESSFEEGITERVSEQPKSAASSVATVAVGFRDAKKEQSKRESYETTRPYSTEEQLKLLEFALEQVFLALPAVRESASSQLRTLDPAIEAVEFLSDQDQAAAPGHRQELSSEDASPTSDLAESIQSFMQKVRAS